MSLFNIVGKNIRKNLKQYALYFFSMIFSLVIYYVFSALTYNEAVQEAIGNNERAGTVLTLSGYVLLVFITLFMFYGNSFFLRKRKKEFGLYNLVGIEKKAIGKMFFIENMILGLGSLIVGIVMGVVFSHLFVSLLFQLMNVSMSISLDISMDAIVKTGVIFTILTILVSFQGYRIVYGHTLIQLFHGESIGEDNKPMNPILSAILGALGIGLLVFGYSLSTRVFTGESDSFLKMFLVLVTVVAGTYLIFKVSIQWFMRIFRYRAKNYYRLTNMLSVSSIIYRMKENASILAAISILSASVLVTVGVSYSMYYTTKNDTRAESPYDYVITSQENAQAFLNEINNLEIEAEMNAVQIAKVSMSEDQKLEIFEDFEEVPLEVAFDNNQVSFIDVSELQKNGFDLPDLEDDEVIIFYPAAQKGLFESPTGNTINLAIEEGNIAMEVISTETYLAMNSQIARYQIAVNSKTFEQISEDATMQQVYTFKVENPEKQEELNEVYHQQLYDETQLPSYYDVLQTAFSFTGVFVFIGGFLGLIFLLATGSIIYFKQISQAEQESERYRVLRKLGFSVKQIVQAVQKQQLFSFGVPLIFGILHSLFALHVFSDLLGINIVVPVAISICIFTVIYFLFYGLTMQYYRKVIKSV